MKLRSETQMNYCKTMWFSRFGIEDTSKINSSQYFRTNLENLTDIVLPSSILLLSNYDQSPLLLITAFEEMWKIKSILMSTNWIKLRNSSCTPTGIQNLNRLSPVDLYLISKKIIWKNQVQLTGFLVYFKLDFYCCNNQFGN